METLDNLVTYAYDLTLGGGAFYIGSSLMLYLVKRWNQLEPKPKSQSAVKIPLALKEQSSEPLALSEPKPELELLEAEVVLPDDI